jgi:hypothetical protein
LLTPAVELKDEAIVNAVEAAMGRLAADPVSRGVRGQTLYRLKNGKVFRPQQFDFHYDASAGRRYHFRAHFYYAEDETAIHVVALKHHPYFGL